MLFNAGSHASHLTVHQRKLRSVKWRTVLERQIGGKGGDPDAPRRTKRASEPTHRDEKTRRVMGDAFAGAPCMVRKSMRSRLPVPCPSHG